MRKILTGFFIAIALMIAGQLYLTGSHWNVYRQGRADEAVTQAEQYKKCRIANQCKVGGYKFFVIAEPLREGLK
jgi:hypothetical protein